MKDQKEKFYFRKPEVIGKTSHRQKERPRVSLKPLKSVFYIFLLALFLYVVTFSDVFKIKKIEIDGVKSVEITDHVNKTLIGRNILLMRTGKYLNDLAKNFPILEEASLVRGLPSTIRITVRERSQVLILCNGQDCFEVDASGYAYQKITRPLDKVALIDEKNLKVNEADKLFSESFIAFYLTALEELDNSSIKLSEARMQETSFKIQFITKEGWSIIMDSSASLPNQMSAVKQIIEKNKQDIHEYIDVRVEGVAYIK